MWNISVRRIAESESGLLMEKGKVLEFNTEEEARIFAKDHVEGKMRYLASWEVVPQKRN